ncbi:hypothetical protein [Sphingomonas guangdongensis]|uniref:hypothetical protein n=1 Tax=Sphingomonas guangdongensis TaxID=1141890 RepID=UPI000BE22A54|nr:hypothetical protein [Sphingomonas guangdongensis]
MRFVGAALAATLGSAVLTGCDRKPVGQVVATVNGEEVTRRELVSEVNAIGGGNLNEEQLKAAQPALVQGLVDRKLLVQEAKRSNLDKNPQFLAEQQRANDLLLVRMLAQSWMGRQTKPEAAAVRAFIADNPQMFGERKAVLVDAIVTPANSITAQQLAPLKSNDAIAAWLTSNKKQFRRVNRPVDTATLPKPFVRQLLSQAGSGEPVALNDGSAFTIMAPRSVRPMPLPSNQWNKVAEQAIAQQVQNKTIADELKRLRENADLNYLPEFAPSSGNAAAPARGDPPATTLES